MLLPATLLCLAGFSQNMNVQSAAVSLKEGDLKMAKDFIDKAAENEQTANNYKMWYYRAKVYYAIDTSRTQHSLDADAAEKASIAYLNCLKTDTKGWYTDECKGTVWVTGLSLYNNGVDAYNRGEYERAIRYYNQIFEVFPMDAEKNLKRNNVTVDILNKNLYFAYNKMGNRAEAKKYLTKLMEVGFNDPKIYLYMERLCLDEKDTAAALVNLAKGRDKFAENTDLINEELNIYILQGKTDILLKKLSDAIEVNPEDQLMFYNRGVINEKNKNFTAAEADYKKAIELKDDYFDANYNLGAMIYNQGADMNNAANDIKDNKKYNDAKTKADERLKQSLPYLEKASDINPKDKNTLISLKQLYARTGDQVKYQKAKDDLEKLK